MEGGRNSSVIRERCSVEGSCNDREATKDDENGYAILSLCTLDFVMTYFE